ncbi:MAG TPA: TonB-dependent receptor, partial [Novosphingobium sp.]|nr:TonB-dependent receptor [Novosphingobium sp.]
DPPLQQVVARNVSLGARIDKPRWNLAVTLFRSDNRNDIQFITSEATGFGYFANVGTTRRQGIEVTGGGRIGRLDLSASYTLLDATYRSTLSVSGSGNSTSDAVAPGFEGNILVQPGNRLPSLPRHLFKAQARYEATKWLTARAELIASSGVYARGNENNADVPDGTYYLGSGKTDAYAVVNAGLDFKPHRAMTMFVMVRNLFNAHYATAAQLGSTGFDASGNFVARPFSSPVIDGERPVVSSTFLAPGAPRQIEVGASWHF